MNNRTLSICRLEPTAEKRGRSTAGRIGAPKRRSQCPRLRSLSG